MVKKFDVICIGAALVDMVSKVARHPSEDDEVFVSEMKILSGGAAANTAVACSKLGLNTAFIGKLGLNDEFAKKIINDFKEASVNINFLKYSEIYNTGSAYVALNSEGDRRIYAHSGAANYLSAQDIKEEEIKKTKIIYLSSLKNIVPFIEASKICKKYNIPVILNPGMLIIEQGFEDIKSLLKLLDILILSENEFKSLLSFPQEQSFSRQSYEEGAQKLKILGIKNIIITLGEKGALLISKDDSQLIETIKIDKVLDTTGAGDAFSAGFIYKFSNNPKIEFNNLINCVKIGNFIAANCIQHLGARYGIPDLNKVKNFEKTLNNKI